MSLRIRSILDLPESLRAHVRGVLQTPAERTEAAAALASQQRAAENSRHTAALWQQLQACDLARYFVPEYQFHVERQWKLDFFSRHYWLGIECHGSVNEYDRGRHLRGSTRKKDGTREPGGFVRDREKMNGAVEAGIMVLEYWPQVIHNGMALQQIQRVLATRWHGVT